LDSAFYRTEKTRGLRIRCGRKRTGAGAIRRRWRAQQAFCQRNDRHGSTSHVKELDRITRFLTGHIMSLDYGADISGA